MTFFFRLNSFSLSNFFKFFLKNQDMESLQKHFNDHGAPSKAVRSKVVPKHKQSWIVFVEENKRFVVPRYLRNRETIFDK